MLFLHGACADAREGDQDQAAGSCFRFICDVRPCDSFNVQKNLTRIRPHPGSGERGPRHADGFPYISPPAHLTQITKPTKEADMILKHKQNGAWRFLDHIERFDVLPDGRTAVKPGLASSIWVAYQRKGETITQNIGEEAYLLNDEGKTIQCIFGRKKRI